MILVYNNLPIETKIISLTMHIYVGIPVIITDVEQKDRRKKKFVDTMIKLSIFRSLYNEESFRSSMY